MKYCEKCGTQLDDNAVFCSGCGNKVIKEEKNQSKTIKEGDIYKCPFCGEFLPSDVTYCPTCRHELRGRKVISSVSEFYDKYTSTETDSEKFQLITMFPIPNNKEDIREFMLIAKSNFDVNQYLSKKGEETLSDAWLSKVELCYDKASMLLNDNDLRPIAKIYEGLKETIKKTAKRRKNGLIGGLVLIVTGTVGSFVFALLYPTEQEAGSKTWLFGGLMIASLCVMALGIVMLVLSRKRKKTIKELEEDSKKGKKK